MEIRLSARPYTHTATLTSTEPTHFAGCRGLRNAFVPTIVLHLTHLAAKNRLINIIVYTFCFYLFYVFSFDANDCFYANLMIPIALRLAH